LYDIKENFYSNIVIRYKLLFTLVNILVTRIIEVINLFVTYLLLKD